MIKNVDQNDPYWFRPVLIFWFTLAIFISSIPMAIMALILETNYGFFAVLLIIITGICLIFFKLRKFVSSFSILLIALSAVVFIQGYSARSAYGLTFLSLAIIISGILCNLRFTTFLFIADSLGIVLYCELGILSWTQQYDSVSGVALVNNISVILPLLFIMYIVAVIVTKVLIGTITTQQKQYEILRKAQQKLITQEKMESISILAGGIAHDFNNLLTAILGNVELIMNEDAISNNVQDCAKDAQKATLQARDLTRQLLNYAKGETTTQIKPENCKAILDEVTKFALRGRKSKVQMVIPDDIWQIKVDRNQIAQVIQNLVLNADNAMPNGGDIDILAVNYCRTESSKDETAKSAIPKDIPPLKPGNYVLISITDHGCGISKANQTKIFQPFFSTKPNGMGLGLTISKTIIEKHQGYIEFESPPNQGATFRIYLPANTTDTDFSTAPNSNKEIRPKFNKKALIYDDQEAVIKTMKNIMQTLGVEMVWAMSSAECLEKIKIAHFDAVILDLTIPGDIGGRELAPIIKEINPQIKTIASSGYANELIANNSKAFGLDHVLNKPYTIDEVARILQDLFNPQKSD